MRSDFAVFILTHGRVDAQYTLKALSNGGYTGRTYMLIDDEDAQQSLYVEKYGKNNVVVFNKEAAVKSSDPMDNFNIHSAILYARRECFKVAREKGLRYFLMLDDDYTTFGQRFISGEELKHKKVRNLDKVFSAALSFFEAHPNILTFAFAQNGDFIGGAMGRNFRKGLMRKAMNCFFCRTDVPIDFRGTMNEDVVAYTTEGSRGKLFLTYTGIAITQLQTQSLSGGMTGVYVDNGTYLKSFYAVMSMPSAVKVAHVFKHKRLHHKVDWEHCVPQIISGRYRKGAA